MVAKCIATALLIAVTAGARAAEDAARFSAGTAVTAVEIPVLVRGKAAEGGRLQASDFEVTVDRKTVPVTGFDVVDLRGSSAAAGAPVPVAARRHLMFVFDLAFASSPTAVERARRAALDMMDTGLHESDLVAVVLYGRQGLELAQDFTADHAKARAILADVGIPERWAFHETQLLERASEPLSRGGGLLEEGEENDDSFIADGLRLSGSLAVAQEEQRARRMAASLAGLARGLSRLNGRKYVVLLSEGWDDNLVVGAERTEAENAAVISGEIWKVKPDLFGSTRARTALQELVKALRRADCVVQAVDIGGVRAGGGFTGNGQQSLFALADGTGGALYEHAGELQGAFGQLLDATSFTYLLAVQPDVPQDGRFHSIRVKVRGQRGVELSHREGFYADPPARQAIAPAAGTEQLSAAALVAGFLTGGEKAYVPVLVDVPIGAGAATSGALAVEIHGEALDGAGRSAGRLAERWVVASSALEAAGRPKAGVRLWTHLELPAGEYGIRLAVTEGGRTAQLDVPVTIPGRPAPASIRLFVPDRREWVLLREEQPQPAGVEYPFQNSEGAYVPAAVPLIEADGTTAVQLIGAGLPKDTAPRVLVVDAAGEPVAGARVLLGGRAVAAAAGEMRWNGWLETKGVAPGEYLAVVSVPAAGGELTAALTFRVEGRSAAEARQEDATGVAAAAHVKGGA